MNHLLLFLALCGFSEARPAEHPLKICVCDVRYIPENGALKIEFRFFQDDLEAALEKQTGQQLDLRTASVANDQLLETFVRQNFDLTINNTPMQLRYTRSTLQDITLVVEWSAENFSPATAYRVEVRNQLLLDAYPDQYDLVRFDFFGGRDLETLRFERAERYLTKTIVRR